MSVPRPTMTDITRALAHLADRAIVWRSDGLEPYVVQTLDLALRELELHIPGLDQISESNEKAAKAFAYASESSLKRGEKRDAFAYALRGLAASPHDPNLWYAAGSACLELAALDSAARAFWHAVWIHPGHMQARRDLVAMRRV